MVNVKKALSAILVVVFILGFASPAHHVFAGGGPDATAIYVDDITVTADGKAKIDPELCIECGACAGVCPVDAPQPE